MARMIPLRAVHSKSPGELDVFVRLRDDPLTSDWIVLHSLDIATHLKKISGEADFVVIIPNLGVLFLEVKACRKLRRESGVWYLGSQSGDVRGPFKQAAEAMHSLRDKLAKDKPYLSRILFWSGVIFTHVPFREKSVEWHQWQVVDSTAMRSGSIGRILRNILERAREHVLVVNNNSGWLLPGSREPYSEQCEEIADFFRPDFEFFQDYKSVAAGIEAELRHFTEEQIGCLDAMEANPRVVFKGPAGTGKTVLALESANRSCNAGRSVLLLCYNKFLGSKLISECKNRGYTFQVKTLHSHMLETAKLKHVAQHADSDFWVNELPRLAVEQMLCDENEAFVFDELIIDEAQDILRGEYLDFLDLSVSGGLSAGKWKMFGDFEKQAIYESANLSLKEFYDRLASDPAQYSLRINCRNTPSIASLAEMLGGLAPGYKRVLRPYDGIEPQFSYYKTDSEQIETIEQALSDLFAIGITGRDIVILSPRNDDHSAAAKIKSESWRDRIRPYGQVEGGGYIRYCSISAFKGLESSAVIVTDLDHLNVQALEDLIYVGVTRSLHRLILVMNESIKSKLLPAANK